MERVVRDRRRLPPLVRPGWRCAPGTRRNLGITISEWGGNVFVAEAGDATVWSIFPGETEYWPAEQQTMVNYRVGDLDAMLAQLRAAGAEVDERVEEQEFGRFGWAVDPDGNRFELWEPA